MKKSKAALAYTHGAVCGVLLIIWNTGPGILATGILTGWDFRTPSTATCLATAVGLGITMQWVILTRHWVFRQLERSVNWLLDRVNR